MPKINRSAKTVGAKIRADISNRSVSFIAHPQEFRDGGLALFLRFDALQSLFDDPHAALFFRAIFIAAIGGPQHIL